MNKKRFSYRLIGHTYELNDNGEVLGIFSNDNEVRLILDYACELMNKLSDNEGVKECEINDIVKYTMNDFKNKYGKKLKLCDELLIDVFIDMLKKNFKEKLRKRMI